MAGPSPDSILSRQWLPWLVLAVLATLPLVCAADDSQSTKGKLEAAQEDFFEAKVRPVLADNCLECHGAEKHKGGCGSELVARDAPREGYQAPARRAAARPVTTAR